MVEGEKVTVLCEYERLHTDNRCNTKRHLVRNVFINGKPFRNHSWIKRSKRLDSAGLRKGDTLYFTAKIKMYLCSKTLELNKIGFGHIRSIEVNPERQA